MKCCCCSGSGGILIALLSAAAVLGTSVVVSGVYSPEDEISQGSYAVMADAISGEWGGVASGDDLPEDMHMTATLEMDDDFAVSGFFSTLDGDAPFEGEFDAESNTLTGTVTVEEGPVWGLTLTLEGDELNGSATEENSGMTLDVALERNED